MSRYLRQSAWLNPEAMPPGVIIGCGGLGSHTAERLAKMGMHDLTIYDDDKVEEHNLGSQNFDNDATGKPKVVALKEHLARVSEARVTACQEKYNGQPIKSGSIVICLVDSIGVRKKIWEQIAYDPNIPLYIEARMAFREGQIYTVVPTDPDQIELYEASFFENGQAEELPCTERSIDFNCAAVGCDIAAIVAEFVKNGIAPRQMTRSLANFMSTIVTDQGTYMPDFVPHKARVSI